MNTSTNSINTDPPIYILYGSQTGTSKVYAEYLYVLLKKRGINSTIVAMNDYEIDLLLLKKNSIILFICSTTGLGDCPDNMKLFWKYLLKKSLASTCLLNLKFTIFGLGDSSYPQYNVVARRLYQRLLNLGAVELCDRVLGDYQSNDGYDVVFNEWIQSIWIALSKILPDKSFNINNPMPVAKDSFSSTININQYDNLISSINSSNNPTLKYGDKFFTSYDLKVLFNNKITSDDNEQDVIHIAFQSEFNYNPGDVLLIRPSNPFDIAYDFMKKYYNLLPNDVITFNNEIIGFPRILSAGELFVKYLDICSMPLPTRYFFEQASFYASNLKEAEKLMELSDISDTDLYRYCIRESRPVIQIFIDFPSLHIPLEILISLVGPISARAYSIASYCEFQIELCVAVVKKTTPMKRNHLGLCSNYLKSLKPGDIASASIINQLSLPLTDNCILIGPGTGISVCRSLLQYKSNCVSSLQNSLLFTGNRYRKRDFLFGNEFSDMALTKELKLYSSFSRDQNFKIYVQNLILENSKLIWELITAQNAFILISGSIHPMSADVRKAFIELFQKEGGLTEPEAMNLLKRMDLQKRYIVDCW